LVFTVGRTCGWALDTDVIINAATTARIAERTRGATLVITSKLLLIGDRPK